MVGALKGLLKTLEPAFYRINLLRHGTYSHTAHVVPTIDFSQTIAPLKKGRPEGRPFDHPVWDQFILPSARRAPL
jgi:hypothetical protein